MSIEIQQKIKHNALEIKEYVSDLYEWEKEMEIKEKVKHQIRKDASSKQQILKETPVPIIKQTPKPEPQKKKDLIRDINTVGEYYKAWDRFDADQELKRLQEQQAKQYRPYNPYESSKNNVRAKPKMKVNISGKRAQQVSDPSAFKDKGNLHFQSLEYEKAIQCYTQCLESIGSSETQENRKLKALVHSNRSMAYLKIQQTSKALADADLSIKLNQQYAKSFYRRAECLKKLGRYHESLRDYRKVKQMEPAQTKADTEIKRIQAFLAKRCRQLREGMVVPFSESLLVGSSRIQIEQTDELAQQQTSTKASTNYLEEL